MRCDKCSDEATHFYERGGMDLCEDHAKVLGGFRVATVCDYGDCVRDEGTRKLGRYHFCNNHWPYEAKEMPCVACNAYGSHSVEFVCPTCVRLITERSNKIQYFGNCSFCDKILKTQEEALAHCAPCKAKHDPQSYSDPVNRPRHYTEHPSKVECIEVTEHMNFCMGNAMKYLWRADMKGGVEDLKKALWYIEREITRRES